MLTERYGLKPQGKSAPMAASKRPAPSSNGGQTWNFGMGSDSNPKSTSYSSGSSEAYNTTHSDFGQSNGFDDVFGGPTGYPGGGSAYDLDLMFSGSNAKSSAVHAYEDDDIFGGMPGFKSSSAVNNASGTDDLLGSFASPSKQSAPVDDLLGGYGGAEAIPSSSSRNISRNVVKNPANVDDLISGFGGISSPSNGYVYD